MKEVLACGDGKIAYAKRQHGMPVPQGRIGVSDVPKDRAANEEERQDIDDEEIQGGENDAEHDNQQDERADNVRVIAGAHRLNVAVELGDLAPASRRALRSMRLLSSKETALFFAMRQGDSHGVFFPSSGLEKMLLFSPQPNVAAEHGVRATGRARRRTSHCRVPATLSRHRWRSRARRPR